MNQILNKIESENISSPHTHRYSEHFFLKSILGISIFLIIGCIFYFMHQVYEENKNQEISKQMVDQFTITTLYSTSSDYNANIINSSTAFVAGMITIPSIDVHYPILSEMTEENLKVAPCRFYGPMPNEVGNLCIAGHNYRNYQFFSKLDSLSNNDTIDIYDANGNKITYVVYDKYIADSSFLECTSQSTHGEKEVTLITCNKPDNSKRIIVKAKEKK